MGIRVPLELKKVLVAKAKKKGITMSKFVFLKLCEETGFKYIPEHIEVKK